MCARGLCFGRQTDGPGADKGKTRATTLRRPRPRKLVPDLGRVWVVTNAAVIRFWDGSARWASFLSDWTYPDTRARYGWLDWRCPKQRRNNRKSACPQKPVSLLAGPEKESAVTKNPTNPRPTSGARQFERDEVSWPGMALRDSGPTPSIDTAMETDRQPQRAAHGRSVAPRHAGPPPYAREIPAINHGHLCGAFPGVARAAEDEHTWPCLMYVLARDGLAPSTSDLPCPRRRPGCGCGLRLPSVVFHPWPRKLARGRYGRAPHHTHNPGRREKDLLHNN
jgi:hypothetical protein